MRLLMGILASVRFSSTLSGDDSLRTRPMERVAIPLRRMGASVLTAEGHPPVTVEGAALHAIRHESPVPSAQVKGAVLLAGLEAEGTTTVIETSPTRDHTERALAHLGAPVRFARLGEVSVSAYRHEGFSASVPGDVSSAAFLVAAAGLTGGALTVRGVGLNPSRTRYLAVMERMGLRTRIRTTATEVGEPVGDLEVLPCDGLVGTTVEPSELPLVIDEVPVLAALAAHAEGDSWFLGAAELRVKESDRLGGLAEAIRSRGRGRRPRGRRWGARGRGGPCAGRPSDGDGRRRRRPRGALRGRGRGYRRRRRVVPRLRPDPPRARRGDRRLRCRVEGRAS
jgi:3-phosphoshikimate 1-carboxyvinyltransferase